MESPGKEKDDFLRAHYADVVPALGNDATLKGYVDFLNEHPDALNVWGRPLTDAAIERFETKLFHFEKRPEEIDLDAKGIVFNASDPAEVFTVRSLVERLIGDRRCKSITILADKNGVAEFGNLIQNDPRYAAFRALDTGSSKPILVSMQELSKQSSWDIIVASLESRNTALMTLLAGGKSNFGARKLIFLNDGWNGLGQRKDVFANDMHIDAVDRVLCVDETAKRRLESQLPAELRDKIEVTGMPMFDALDVPHAAEYRTRGRAALGLYETDVGLLYLGDVTDDFNDFPRPIDRELNQRTLQHVIQSATQIARRHPGKQYVVMVRPHPRDAHQSALLSLCAQKVEVPNVRIVNASREAVFIQDASYAADIIIMSVGSTETFLAPRRGRQGVFLGFTERGLGADALEETFGNEYRRVLTTDATTVVDSVDALVQELEKDHQPISVPPTAGSTQRVLDALFAK